MPCAVWATGSWSSSKITISLMSVPLFPPPSCVLTSIQEDRCGGYRIPPNMSKVFYHWGLEERILNLSIKSKLSSFIRCEYFHPFLT